MHKVSVIVLTYNPNFDQLVKTVNSILNQKTVDFEIVLADDGSKNSYFDEIETYFSEVGFKNYKIVKNESNQGTCKNIMSGLTISEGEYVKLISPGDFVFDENVLSNWIEYMTQNNCLISFGKEASYKIVDDNVECCNTWKKPQLIDEFINHKSNNVKSCYALLNDTPIGANFLVKRETFIKYLSYLIDRVIYAEDYAMKLMALDDIDIYYFDQYVIWYEYGDGISTNSKWINLLLKDLEQIECIITEMNFQNKYSRRIQKYLLKAKDKKSKILKYIYFPNVLFLGVKKKLNKKNICFNGSLDVLYRIVSYKEYKYASN